MLLADPWYTSGATLGIAGIAATLLLGVLGVWAAFRAANPRRELSYQVRAIVPIVSTATRGIADVEIRLDDKILIDPQVVEICVTNRGRRDIPTTAFDQDRPLRIDVAAPILKILKNESVPTDFNPPRINTVGTGVTLGPDLIRRRQAITLSLLVDGPTPKVSIPDSPLIDINIRAQQGDTSSMAPRLVTAGVVGSLPPVAAALEATAAVAGGVISPDVGAGLVAAAVGAGALTLPLAGFGITAIAGAMAGSIRKWRRGR